MTNAEIVQMLVNARNDQEWFSINFDKFKEEYNNRFIAIRDKSVLDDASRIEDLMEKLEIKGIDTSNVLVKFVTKVKLIL